MQSEASEKNFGMKSIAGPLSVFLDTSVVISGLYSATGASAAVLSLEKLGRLRIAISPEVIREAEDVINNKLPELALPWFNLLFEQHSITPAATPEEILRAHTLVPTEDAPIFAGFLKSRATILITLDREFRRLAEDAGALFPSEFLENMRLLS